MAIKCVPEVEPADAPTTRTLPQRQRGGWTLKPEPRVGLDLSSDDDMLLLENKTEISWTVYHGYHLLGIIDPGELLIFHLCKHGSLNVRPHTTSDSVEYLVLALTYDTNQVYIYRRQMSKDVEVYDMRAV